MLELYLTLEAFVSVGIMQSVFSSPAAPALRGSRFDSDLTCGPGGYFPSSFTCEWHSMVCVVGTVLLLETCHCLLLYRTCHKVKSQVSGLIRSSHSGFLTLTPDSDSWGLCSS